MRSCCGSCTMGTCAAPRSPPRPPLSLSSRWGTPAPSPAPACHPDDAFQKLGDCTPCHRSVGLTLTPPRVWLLHQLTCHYHPRTGKSPPPDLAPCGPVIWRKTCVTQSQSPPPQKISESTQLDTIAQSTYRTRGSCSLPFPPKHKGKNSQGPVKIKIYNLYNVLHHRHLLVISTSVWLGNVWMRWV